MTTSSGEGSGPRPTQPPAPQSSEQPAAEPGAQPAAQPAGPSGGALPTHQVRRTRASGVWAGLWVAVVLGIGLLIFIFQNAHSVPVNFVTLHGSFPLAAGLLAAAVVGALVTILVGTVRIAQLRRVARRHRAEDAGAHRGRG